MGNPTQTDNLVVIGMANAAVAFFANVMIGLQSTYGTNTGGWANVINDLDDIIYADSLRSLGINSTQTAYYQANSLLNNRRTFTDRTSTDYVNILTGVDTSNGIITANYQAIIPEKSFSGNTVANATALSNFINTTLNNTTYTSANVATSIEYAVNNGYVGAYSTIDSTSFDFASIQSHIQDESENRLALLKTNMLNNKYIR